MRLLLLMTAVAFIAADGARAQSAARERRGAMAFHYGRPLTAAELRWYSRFDLLVTHDPLPRTQVDALHARGTRLLLYEWSIAFYRSLATPWQRALPQSALLNAQPLRGHAGATDADAFYYDPASAQHERERGVALAEKLRRIAYDGVFFDTPTSESVHPEALAEFKRRHDDEPYDVAYGRFLRMLRRELKDGVIVTNQGYRAAEHILPFVDVDVSESLITRPVNGRFALRPWLERGDEWNSISFLMRNLIAPVQRAYPRVRFVHLNYEEDLDQTTVARVVGIARLYGAEGFVAQPSISGGTLGAAYFVDLGAARPRVESTTKRTAYRFFARGLVAANFGRAPLRIANSEGATYENVVTHATTRAATIVIPPDAVMIFRRR